MAPLEIEVKFYLSDPDAARERILAMNARFSGKSVETNIRFEDRDHTLIRKKSLLRVRKTDHHSLLTFKAPPPDTDVEFKVHRELEVTVSDFDTTCNLLEMLGYHPVQQYEKIRETYEVKGAQLCLDRMPFGYFLEIEGNPSVIRATAAQLGLPWGERILTSYLAIFDRLKTGLNLEFDDVTFENFSDLAIDFNQHRHWFIAG